jgi:hypothetical protein
MVGATAAAGAAEADDRRRRLIHPVVPVVTGGLVTAVVVAVVEEPVGMMEAVDPAGEFELWRRDPFGGAVAAFSGGPAAGFDQ